MFTLPNGELTEDAVRAVEVWQKHAETEAARCAEICRERAESHRQTIVNSGTADKRELDARAREADKCAEKIESGTMLDGRPLSSLGPVNQRLRAERDQLVLERDRANQAYAELHASHRALTIARDDNANMVRELRDVKFACRALVRELHVRAATVMDGDARRAIETVIFRLDDALKG